MRRWTTSCTKQKQFYILELQLPKRNLIALTFQRRLKSSTLQSKTLTLDQGEQPTILGLATEDSNSSNTEEQEHEHESLCKQRNTEFREKETFIQVHRHESGSVGWYVMCRNSNIPISGAMLKEEATLIAEKLDITDFVALLLPGRSFKLRRNRSIL